MKATHDTIRTWLHEADDKGATHVVIMSDDFSHDYYPVPCRSRDAARDTVRLKSGQNMQTVVEVYNLSASWEAQLQQERCMNY